MLNCFVEQPISDATSIYVVLTSEFSSWQAKQDESIRSWLQATQFRAEHGAYSLLPNVSGKITAVLCCITSFENFWGVGNLPCILPEGVYQFELPEDKQFANLAIAWGLGAYQFTAYKKSNKKPAKLALPAGSRKEHIVNMVESIYLVRDLINTPADDMGPSELALAAIKLANDYQAEAKEIVGEDLLTQRFPTIYTVGRASDDAPRLIDFRWGNKAHPKVTLVGKGVCFDSGGLDIKPASGMLLMKKDMGGAAHVLGLARMIMQAKLPIQLRVLIPIVENAISGNAYRPGDVIQSRKGITIEIGNTDAEGRVILADALTAASEDQPDLLIDIATLTGAARIALGTELPALFANHDLIANDLLKHADKTCDPLWRLPLFTLYRDALNSSIADINNAGSDSYAGAITAALFLQEFVPLHIPWLHFDLMAWNVKSRPGRPQGGEAMGLRALFNYLENKYPKS